MRRKISLKNLVKKSLIGALVLVGLGALYIVILWYRLPDPSPLQWEEPKTTAFIEQKCENQYCHYSWAPLAEMSRFTVQAVILSEDHRFYSHQGFDWRNIWSATKQNLREGQIVWGGSSLTMQLAKNLYLTPQKTLWRKMKETLLTIKLERALSKERILELYLNFAEWGPNIFGIAAASHFYLEKEPSEIGPHEAAFLASILPNPNKVGTPGWRDRFLVVGSRIFDLLLSHYLPPSKGVKKTTPCQDPLNKEMEEQTEYLITKLFSTFAIETLSGEAALMDRKQLMEVLSPEERELVDRLLQRAGQARKKIPLMCQRTADKPKEALSPFAQYIPVLGKKTFWVPNAAKKATESLFKKAADDHIPLIFRSAYRNEGYQTYLLLTKLRQNNYCPSGTLRQAALPEESEHGCFDRPAFDFGSARLEEIPFEQTKTYAWLKRHAPSFGFRLSYPEGNDRGIDFEPWHWQFVGLADPI